MKGSCIPNSNSVKVLLARNVTLTIVAKWLQGKSLYYYYFHGKSTLYAIIYSQIYCNFTVIFFATFLSVYQVWVSLIWLIPSLSKCDMTCTKSEWYDTNYTKSGWAWYDLNQVWVSVWYDLYQVWMSVIWVISSLSECDMTYAKSGWV